MKNKTSLVFLYYFAFASFVFGAKLWLIGKFGNATPTDDQWDAEADSLYKPFINGTLRLSSLFNPHNEHRIFTTRLLALTELMVNGIWNPLLQMVVNAALHIVVLVVAIALIVRVVGRPYLSALLLFSAFLFALPYAYENTLCGFQAQFYFVLLFSILSLWFTTTREPFSTGWVGGLIWSLLAFFSFSSGVFCLAAAVAVGFIFYLFKLRKTNKQIWAILITAGLFMAGVALTPLNENQAIKAVSVPQFFRALSDILCWPAANKLFALLQNAPAPFFCILMFRRRPTVNNPKWFLVALIIWMLGVSFAIAYGRALAPLCPRYLDLFVILILLNFSCSLILFQEFKTKWKKTAFFGLIIWVLSAGICLQMFNARPTQRSLRATKAQKIIQEMNTKNYVQTKDFSYLKNKGEEEIPYPSAERLASILSSQEVRDILPTNIAPTNRSLKEGRFDKVVNVLIANYYIFMVIGLLSALAGCLLNFYSGKQTGRKTTT